MRVKITSIVFLVLSSPGWSQVPHHDSVPIYKITVVQRAIKAINYQRRGGPTKIDFKGTVLLPDARGEARVENKQGVTEIEAKFSHLQPPTKFGPEFLTYVIWAITPDGRAVNLGEAVADDSNKSRIKLTTQLPTFGLLMTAEPYFAVTHPSDVVVMENIVRPDTVGRVEDVEAKYELMPRGQYTLNLRPADLPSAHMETKIPLDQYEAVLELYQARNAVQIARAAGADQYAGDTYRRAEQLLQQAEGYRAQRGNSKLVVSTAREAAQTAEDSRAIALKRKAGEGPLPRGTGR